MRDLARQGMNKGKPAGGGSRGADRRGQRGTKDTKIDASSNRDRKIAAIEGYVSRIEGKHEQDMQELKHQFRTLSEEAAKAGNGSTRPQYAVAEVDQERGAGSQRSSRGGAGAVAQMEESHERDMSELRKQMRELQAQLGGVE